MALRVSLAIVSVFMVFLTGCVATRGVVREELGLGLAPLSEQAARTEERLAALETRQAGTERSIAVGFGLVGESVEALASQTATLRQKVDQAEGAATAQFRNLGNQVAAAKKAATAAGKSAQGAQNAAERADIRAQAAEATRVADEKKTRAVVEAEAKAGRDHATADGNTTRAAITADGDTTRALTSKEASDTRTHVSTEVGGVRNTIEDRAKKILEELEKRKSPPSSPAPLTGTP